MVYPVISIAATLLWLEQSAFFLKLWSKLILAKPEIQSLSKWKIANNPKVILCAVYSLSRLTVEVAVKMTCPCNEMLCNVHLELDTQHWGEIQKIWICQDHDSKVSRSSFSSHSFPLPTEAPSFLFPCYFWQVSTLICHYVLYVSYKVVYVFGAALEQEENAGGMEKGKQVDKVILIQGGWLRCRNR